jgi:ribosomal protein S18 acetylase RimI-like enzyme
VYASTREAEMVLVPWSDTDKRAFVKFQFEAQHMHYRAHFADAEFSVILARGEPAGRLYVDRRPDEIRLVDIALLPEFRGAGIGSTLLRALIAEAGAANMPLRIHVEQHNPALGLYLRLGFTALENNGVYILMERRPELAQLKMA